MDKCKHAIICHNLGTLFSIKLIVMYIFIYSDKLIQEIVILI